MSELKADPRNRPGFRAVAIGNAARPASGLITSRSCDGCGRTPASAQSCGHPVCWRCYDESPAVTIQTLNGRGRYVKCPICCEEEYK